MGRWGASLSHESIPERSASGHGGAPAQAAQSPGGQVCLGPWKSQERKEALPNKHRVNWIFDAQRRPLREVYPHLKVDTPAVARILMVGSHGAAAVDGTGTQAVAYGGG